MLKKFSLSCIALILSGCMSTSTTQNKAPVMNVDVGKNIFTSDFIDNVQNENTFKENVDLLRKIEADKELMSVINSNQSKEDLYYSYYKSFILLQKEILTVVKEREAEKRVIEEKESKINKEIKFLLNACENSKHDIADDLQNLAKENPNHFQNLSEEDNIKIDKCLTKVVESKKEVSKPKKEVVVKKEKIEPKKIETVKKEQKKKTVVKKETVKPKVVPVVKKESKEENGNKLAFEKIKDKLDKNFFIIQAHCNEEDSYLLPDDVVFFKSKIKDLSNGDKNLETYAYNHYKNEIKECKEYYTSNTLLGDSEVLEELDKQEIPIEKVIKKEDANSKTLKIVQNMGYNGYNFKESLNEVIETVFKGSDDMDSFLKEQSSIVRRINIEKENKFEFYTVLDYNGHKYFILSDEANQSQIYFPIDDKVFKDNKIQRKHLYYSLFDYGYIDNYKTLILKKVDL